jgi:hypothetical protein
MWSTATMRGQPAALAQRLAQLIDVGDAALVRHRDLAIEHHRGQACGDEFFERRAE